MNMFCVSLPVDIPNEDICKLPLNKGYCRASMPRFYYDAGLGKCQFFLYGGCLGNRNNFKTEDECKHFCVK